MWFDALIGYISSYQRMGFARKIKPAQRPRYKTGSLHWERQYCFSLYYFLLKPKEAIFYRTMPANEFLN
jgi:hypothetical protein